MKKYCLVIIAGAMVLLSASCRRNVLHGEGKKGESAPAVASFTAVDISVPVKAIITVQDGSTPGIQLQGYENVLGHVKTKVEDGTLKIYTDLNETWKLDGDDDIVARITLPAIKALSLESAPSAEVHGNITGASFKLDVSGAGKVTIDNINVTSFSTDISGAGSITVNGGKVDQLAYEINGAGKIMGYPLQAANVSTSISGVGKCEVTALQKLEATVSGAGMITYKGHPALTQQVSGVGKITAAE